MTRNRPTRDAAALLRAAIEALDRRKEDIDKLNVFPVPDGDTGTNMALTMQAVLHEVAGLPADAPAKEVCRAVTRGSLMGARGNSGVILSQILRGICEVAGQDGPMGAQTVADALERSRAVAYQAVRKPVEGTMLTVIKDAAHEALAEADAGHDVDSVFSAVVRAAFASVRRGPDLLPVLKENGVVDSGGFGVAVLMQGFAEAWEGRTLASPTELTAVSAPAEVTIEQAEDWDDTEYLYCTEFLLFGEGLDRDAVQAYVTSVGGSELVVGDDAALKIHVHTDDPAAVLAHATGIGEIAEVHVNNMRRQSRRRAETLARQAAPTAPSKPVGFVAVAAGDGLVSILKSLGVDQVVSGGQTMNPSTAELLAAAEAVDAAQVVILPDNRNIVMAAQQVDGLAERSVHVVPTVSVPQAFAAMLAFDSDTPLHDALIEMEKAAATVRTGEVTLAVKDAVGKAGRIRSGQVIGIADHEVEVVGDDIAEVSERLLDMIAEGGETLTLLAGADLPSEDFEAIGVRLAAAHPELELESRVGGQPLYPLIMAVE